VVQGVHRLRTLIVNVYLVAGADRWVLIDTGVAGTQSRIRDAAARLFGHDRRPAAILLTHGHFDHVGALPQLAEEWDVPIYVHPLELPYVTGRAKYPRANPAAGGGVISLISPLFPRGPYDFGSRVRVLPDDGSVPGLAGWRWIHTPGIHQATCHFSAIRIER
jgi:glyoxylase-like metal-dependent hydrolase (beta-lactamase superfamily II)